MRAAVQLSNRERHTMTDMRALAEQGFSRAAGAPLIACNSIRLLQDARENYAAGHLRKLLTDVAFTTVA